MFTEIWIPAKASDPKMAAKPRIKKIATFCLIFSCSPSPQQADHIAGRTGDSRCSRGYPGNGTAITQLSEPRTPRPLILNSERSQKDLNPRSSTFFSFSRPRDCRVVTHPLAPRGCGSSDRPDCHARRATRQPQFPRTRLHRFDAERDVLVQVHPQLGGAIQNVIAIYRSRERLVLQFLLNGSWGVILRISKHWTSARPSRRKSLRRFRERRFGLCLGFAERVLEHFSVAPDRC